MLYYNRQGQPISSTEYCRLAATGQKTVAKSFLPGDYWVSTVWLGLDHNHADDGPPLIFETMVFLGENFSDLDCRRYSTEEAAFEGHIAMVAKWKAYEAP